MQNEILLTAMKEKALIQNKRMHKYLYEANSADINSSFKQIEESFHSLYIAKGFYQSLVNLGLLDNGDTVVENIERIEAKLLYVKEEKRRNLGMGFKRKE